MIFGVEARAALGELNHVDLEVEFATRACVMKSPPPFLKGQYRAAVRFALSKADRARDAQDERAAVKAWKLFLLFPQLLLHKQPRGGHVPKSRLKDRFTDFARGSWGHLLTQSRQCADQAAVASRQCLRRREDDIQRRANHAQALVQLSELSAGRHAMGGASLAPGTNASLRALRETAPSTTGTSAR